ncbi:MAG: hypothetical protein AAF211_16750 [Myxococcota bacterium]
MSPLVAGLSSALACTGSDGDDPRRLLAIADVVFEGAIRHRSYVHGRDDERDGFCGPPNDVSIGLPATYTLDVRRVWKGDVPPVAHLVHPSLVDGSANGSEAEARFEVFFGPWAQWAYLEPVVTVFLTRLPDQSAFYSPVSNCGVSPFVGMGPPVRAYPYEKSVEELLWEAVESDDADGVRNALATGLVLVGSASWEMRNGLVGSVWTSPSNWRPRCPPAAYDVLVQVGLRDPWFLAGCGPERLGALVHHLHPTEQAWWSVADEVDLGLAQWLTEHGQRWSPWVIDQAAERACQDSDQAAAVWWTSLRSGEPAGQCGR